MNTEERLRTWRAEIAVERTAAIEALRTLETELEQANAAASATDDAHRILTDVFSGNFKRVTTPLAERLAWLRNAEDEAKGRAMRVDRAVEAARGRLAELERALRQLDHLIPATEERAA